MVHGRDLRLTSLNLNCSKDCSRLNSLFRGGGKRISWNLEPGWVEGELLRLRERHQTLRKSPLQLVLKGRSKDRQRRPKSMTKKVNSLNCP